MLAQNAQTNTTIAELRTIPNESSASRTPKPNNPQEFDGSSDKLNSFLTECTLVFELQPTIYANDSTKIHYMISYLRGMPMLAIRPYLQEDPKPEIHAGSHTFRQRQLPQNPRK